MTGEAPLLEAMPDCRREILRETVDDDHFIHHWRCSGRLASDGRLVEWAGSGIHGGQCLRHGGGKSQAAQCLKRKINHGV